MVVVTSCNGHLHKSDLEMKSKLIYILVSLLVVGGCALSPTDFSNPNPETFYQRKLQFEIDGKEHVGYAIVDLKGKYNFKVMPNNSAELMRVITCHREMFFEDPGSKFKFQFIPTSLELKEVCSMDLGSFDTKRQHEWAHIEFRLHERILVETTCNGTTSKQFGVSVCQSKHGLLQQITFPMKIKYKSNCAMLETLDDQVFQYRAPKGFCQIVFYVSSDVYHRHIIMGYEDVIFGEL